MFPANAGWHLHVQDDAATLPDPGIDLPPRVGTPESRRMADWPADRRVIQNEIPSQILASSPERVVWGAERQKILPLTQATVAQEERTVLAKIGQVAGRAKCSV
jgi:hypothetical protein